MTEVGESRRGSMVRRAQEPGARRAGAKRELTAREHEVAQLLALGRSNAEIASSLGVSVHAVKFHVSSVLQKLRAKNRTEAAVAYVRQDSAGTEASWTS